MSDQSYLDALQAVEGARQKLESDMIAAKSACHADPTPENRAAYDQAVAILQMARSHERGGRGTQVAGDVFTSQEG